MILDRDDQPEAMNKDLRAYIVKIILDKLSDMRVGISPLSAMYIHNYCAYFPPCFAKHRGYSRGGGNVSGQRNLEIARGNERAMSTQKP